VLATLKVLARFAILWLRAWLRGKWDRWKWHDDAPIYVTWFGTVKIPFAVEITWLRIVFTVRVTLWVPIHMWLRRLKCSVRGHGGEALPPSRLVKPLMNDGRVWGAAWLCAHCFEPLRTRPLADCPPSVKRHLEDPNVLGFWGIEL
jgi:hypothetical protein